NLGALQQDSQAEPLKTRAEKIRDQLRSDIKTSLQRNASAQNYQEWKTSGYTAEAIFDQAFAFDTKHSALALCSSLNELKPHELAIFEPQIELSTLDCRKDLLSRTQSYWSSVEKKLIEQN